MTIVERVLWSESIADRVSQLFGRDSRMRAKAIDQNPNLIEALEEVLEDTREGLTIENVVDQLAAPDGSSVHLARASELLAKLNLALQIEKLLPDLTDALRRYNGLSLQVPEEIQSTEEMLGINDAIDPHAPVDTY